MEAVADTSIFISQANVGPLPNLPVEFGVSVMTIAELHLGVLLAGDEADRSRRLDTATSVEALFDPLPVDLAIARRYAAMGAEARRLGRKPKVIDLIIAATASIHGVPVYSRDRDFARIPGVDVVIV